MARYAVTVTPDTSTALWQIGSSILGYDAATGLDSPFPDHPAFHDPLSLAWSAAPRQFGLQAFLRAPFELAEHVEAAVLERDLAAFAAGRAAFDVDLTLSVFGQALALVSVPPNDALQSLADDVVRHLEPFRAPLTVEERERQHPDTLIQRQVDNLDTWGSPFVFDDFLFNIALTGELDPDDRHRLEPILQEILRAALPLRLRVDAVSLSVQADRAERFVVKSRLPFGR